MGLFSGIGKALGSVVGAITDPIGSLIGSGIGFLGQESANSANSGASKDQMAFQERMSSTAYQRAVADMTKAGLNPMLAYSQGGASAPLGSMPNIQNSAGQVGQGVASAIQAKQVMANLQQVNSQTDLNENLAMKAKADAAYSVSSARSADAQAAKTMSEKAITDAALPAAKNKASGENTWFGRNVYPHTDRFMNSLNKLPILNWFSD